ncbi:GlsB/YeaQ/YmgE family stress response membrane protein [Cystobacter ferrugineus]|uniref:Transglycosylase n=1 Tax=Cystobacter ferrugineus TaxID=83449 RepID=A0A1L9AWQ1_9BACT|nr:GlsB/YeaQ/YmgE family stress response membrane protein [Cystobacter ferrugineus]OJH34417.1 hypothetical protein BON30_43620 [Cystobacter ferrugineus]
MSIIWFIVVGLVAGLIARALVPGRQSMGLIATMLLGIVGSFVGGFIGALFSPGRSVLDLQPSGLIMSVIGAIVVLFLAGWAGRGRRIHA